MTIAQNSVLIQFIVTLWTVLRDSWGQSVVGRMFARVGRALCRGVAGSALCQWIWRDGIFVREWPESLSCRFFTAVINIPVAIIHWIYEKGKKLFDNSILFRFGSTLGGASFIFLGLAMVVMLIVPHNSWNNSYMLLLMYGVAMVFFVGCAARRKWRLELDTMGPWFTLFAGFIVYGFLGSLSTTFENGVLYGLTHEYSPTGGAQNLSLRFFIFYVIAFLIVLFVVSTVHRKEDLQLLVVIAVAGLVVASLYGCYQGIIGVPVVASQQDMSLNKDMPGRIYSFFDNPNNFAEILVMLMPFLMALFLNAKTWRGKMVAVLAAVPCVASIGYTLSRGSWIALAIAVVIFIVLLNWRFLPLLIVGGLAVVPFLPESIMNRILTIGNMQDSSTTYRFAIYHNTKYLIEDYGVRGIGLGTDVMRQVFRVYPTMYDGNYPIHTHNNYLQMLGELGIFGVITYLGMALGQVKRGIKAFYSGTDRQVKNLLAAGVSAFCGILVMGVAEYTWFYPRNLFVWFFIFGVITACVKLLKKPHKAM